MGVIYKATNKINGKSYIGQTSFLFEQRKQQHLRRMRQKKYNTPFYSALRKYDKEDWEWTILYEVPNEQLNLAEICAIYSCDTLHPNGYNLTTGGEVFQHSEESKEKMRQNHSHYWQGKKLSEEHKARLTHLEKYRGMNKGKKLSKEWRDKIVKGLIGRKHKEETKEKIGNATAHYYKVTINGQPLIIKNLSKYCRKNNLKEYAIRSSLYKYNIYRKENLVIEYYKNE